MLLGFATTNKLIELQDKLGVDVVHYAGDLCYAGLSGDLTPFNNKTEDDEFGHVCIYVYYIIRGLFIRYRISNCYSFIPLLCTDLGSMGDSK